MREITLEENPFRDIFTDGKQSKIAQHIQLVVDYQNATSLTAYVGNGETFRFPKEINDGKAHRFHFENVERDVMSKVKGLLDGKLSGNYFTISRTKRDIFRIRLEKDGVVFTAKLHRWY